MTNIFQNTYARKADAKKAAIKAGLVEGTFTIEPTADGRFQPTAIPVAPKGDKGAKFATALQMVQEGTTTQQIMEANDWAKHTVTNFLCTLRTVRNIKVDRERLDNGEFLYKIAS